MSHHHCTEIMNIIKEAENLCIMKNVEGITSHVVYKTKMPFKNLPII